MNTQQLVLFDIDGTLIRHVGKPWSSGGNRFLYALKKVFGIDVEIDYSVNYNGWVDPQIISFFAKPYGITREQVMGNMPKISLALREYADDESKLKKQLYVSISEAVDLAVTLSKDNRYSMGLLTGNVYRMAEWKLKHAGIPDIFPFGLFGDEADNRIDLAKTVFEKARIYFHIDFQPKDIVVIGDAIPDIRCGKAIGATTIIAMTGGHSTREELSRENPDLLVDSLMDEQVLALLGLKQ